MFRKIIIILIIINCLLAIWLSKDFLKNLFLKTRQVDISNYQMNYLDKNTLQTKEKNSTEKQDKLIATGEIKMVFKSEGKLIFYNRNNFLETDLEGSYKKNLGTYPFDNFSYGKCSSLGKICLIRNNGIFSVYNINLKKNFVLKEKIEEVVFNYQGDGLVYLFSEGDFSDLDTSNLDGGNWLNLKKIKGKNLKIAVSPKNDQISFFSSEAEGASGIFLTSLLDKKEAEQLNQNDIIDVMWSPDGNKILFSYYDYSVFPKRVQLAYFDLQQKRQYDLGLPGISQKCVWSEDSNYLYCGALTSTVPQDFILNNWYSNQFVSQDVFWKVDLVKNEKERLFLDYPKVDSFNLLLFENRLIFIDKISGALISRDL